MAPSSCLEKKLNNLVSGFEIRNEIYASLVVLLEEKNLTKFKQMMENFSVEFVDKEPAFIKYFDYYYYNRTDLWSMSHRLFPYSYTDTNMYCEYFHNKLKTSYFERKFNRRVDNLIDTLLKIENMYLSHQYRIITGTPTSVYPPTYYKRHNNGLRTPDGDVYVKSTNSRLVKSQTNRDVLYEVKVAETCSDNDQCYCRCIKLACLSLCIHLYTRECSDNHALCKHIHKIHSLIVRQIPSFENIFSDNEITEDVECIPDSVSSVTLVESGIDSSVEETCDDERKIRETELLLVKLNCLIQDKVVMRTLSSYLSSSLKTMVSMCESIKDGGRNET
ncbi:c2H2-type domain-containing protein [Trichonephila clavipes]|nr:c2H2-type domain-containing protein [Trichonephila clavipes]